MENRMKMYTLEEVREILGINENTLKTKIFTSRSLRSVKIGNQRYVSEFDLQKYQEREAWKKLHPKKLRKSAEQVKEEYQETGRRMTTYSHKKKE
jgi:hypothetical protein